MDLLCALLLKLCMLRAEAYGYGIVVGFGLFFSLFTSLIVFLDYRFAACPRAWPSFCAVQHSSAPLRLPSQHLAFYLAQMACVLTAP